MKRFPIFIITLTLLLAPRAHAQAFFGIDLFGVAHADDDADESSGDAEGLRSSARALVGKLYERLERHGESDRVIERPETEHNEVKSQGQFSSSLVQLNYARNILKSSQRTLTDQRQYLLEYIGALISYDEYLRVQMEQLPVIDEDVLSSFSALVSADVATLRAFESRVRSAESVDALKAVTKELLDQRKQFSQLHMRRLTVLAHIGVMQRQSLAALTIRAGEQRTAATAFTVDGTDMTGIIADISAVESLIAASTDRLTRLTASTTAATLGTRELQKIHEELVRERNAHREIFERILEIAREANKLIKDE